MLSSSHYTRDVKALVLQSMYHLCVTKKKRIRIDWCKTSTHQHSDITINQVLVLFPVFE